MGLSRKGYTALKDNKQTAQRVDIGGQAVLEGVMMKSPEYIALAVRRPDGSVVLKRDPYEAPSEKHKWMGWPLIRGSVNFLSSMINGVKALMFSADYFPEEEGAQPDKLDAWLEKHVPAEKLQGVLITVAVVLAVGMSVGLFMVLPALVAGLLGRWIANAAVLNLIEGVVKVALFMGYLILCSRQKDIKRVFAYHGAEHKTIFCYEHGKELTVENIREERRFHPRCGTSFLVLMLLVSILIGFFIPATLNKWVLTAIKLAIMPLVMGIGYELIKFCGRHDNWLTRIIAAPGLWFQRITVLEPDDAMIECAIAAMKEVIPDDGSDAW